MAKKKKTAPTKVRKTTKKAFEKPYFMGLTKSQTKSLSVGIIVLGFGLFILAGYTYKNRQTITTSVLPPAMTTAAPTAKTSPSTETPTPSVMTQKPPITVLSNTTSKVTYTVRNGDSLATIGETLCKSDRAWVSIANTNLITYPYVINPGETYIITCN